MFLNWWEQHHISSERVYQPLWQTEVPPSPNPWSVRVHRGLYQWVEAVYSQSALMYCPQTTASPTLQCRAFRSENGEGSVSVSVSVTTRFFVNANLFSMIAEIVWTAYLSAKLCNALRLSVYTCVACFLKRNTEENWQWVSVVIIIAFRVTSLNHSVLF